MVSGKYENGEKTCYQVFVNIYIYKIYNIFLCKYIYLQNNQQC